MTGRALLFRSSILLLLCFSSSDNASVDVEWPRDKGTLLSVPEVGNLKITAYAQEISELANVKTIRGQLTIKNTDLKKLDFLYHSLDVHGGIEIVGNAQLIDLNGIFSALARSQLNPTIDIHSNHPASTADYQLVNIVRHAYAEKNQYEKLGNIVLITRPRILRLELGSQICTSSEVLLPTNTKTCTIVNGDITITDKSSVDMKELERLKTVLIVNGCVTIKNNDAPLNGLSFLQQLEKIDCKKENTPALTIKGNKNLGSLALFSNISVVSCNVAKCVELGEEIMDMKNYKEFLGPFLVALTSSDQLEVVEAPLEDAPKMSAVEIAVLGIAVGILCVSVILVVLWLVVFKLHRDEKTRAAMKTDKSQESPQVKSGEVMKANASGEQSTAKAGSASKTVSVSSKRSSGSSHSRAKKKTA